MKNFIDVLNDFNNIITDVNNKIKSNQSVYHRDYQYEHILLSKLNCKTYDDLNCLKLSKMMDSSKFSTFNQVNYESGLTQFDILKEIIEECKSNNIDFVKYSMPSFPFELDDYVN